MCNNHFYVVGNSKKYEYTVETLIVIGLHRLLCCIKEGVFKKEKCSALC